MSSLNWGRTTQKIGRRVLKNLWHSFRRRDCIVGNPPAGVIMCPTVNTSKCNMKTETIGAGRACSLYIRSEHPVSVFRLFAIFFFFFCHILSLVSSLFSRLQFVFCISTEWWKWFYGEISASIAPQTQTSSQQWPKGEGWLLIPQGDQESQA